MIDKLEFRFKARHPYEELNSEKCFCGKKKRSGLSVCFSCWRMLPRSIQRDLYDADKYVEAHRSAQKILVFKHQQREMQSATLTR